MNSLQLNFASSPFRNKTPYYLAYGLGVALVVVMTAYNGWALNAYSESRSILETDYAAKKARIDELRRESSHLQDAVKKEDVALVNDKASFTNSLLEKRRFSWTDLLNSLEEVQPYQVRLLSVMPRIQEKGILIDARAVSRSLEDFWNFQHNLLVDPRFRRVYPGGYLKSEETGEYIFNIQFNYFPNGAPPEVQGLSPEDMKILEAPGAGDALGDEASLGADDMPAEEAPPPPHKDPGPHNAGKGPTMGSPGGGPSAASGVKPAGFVPITPPGTPPAQPAAGPNPGKPLNPVVVGGPAPGAPAVPNPAVAGQKVPYHGRGAMPGTAGVQPTPVKRTDPNLPRIPVAVTPVPISNEDSDKGDDEEPDPDDEESGDDGDE